METQSISVPPLTLLQPRVASKCFFLGGGMHVMALGQGTGVVFLAPNGVYLIHSDTDLCLSCWGPGPFMASG